MSTFSLQTFVAFAATMLAMLSAPAVAGQFGATADGSGSDNPDLLNDGFSDCSTCDFSDVPRDRNLPFFDLDWQLALRGGYVQSTTGDSFIGSILPTVSLTHQGLRSSFGLTASAELTQGTIDPFRIASARVGLAGAYRFDELTALSASANLALTQDAPNLPATVTSPQLLSGDVELAVSHDVGRFGVTVRGNASRTLYGPTTAAGGVSVNNSWQNNTVLGSGLRLSMPVTPVLSVFGDAAASYQYFDGVSPTLLAKLDGPLYTAKAGVAYDPSSVISGEASIGLGLRRFDAGFADVVATLYDARLTFRPDETLTLNATFGTAIGAPGTSSGGAGLARVTYSAAADATYVVNPWLSLRGSAGWYRADIAGTGGAETGYGVGVGSDYALNENTAVTADYTFSHVETPTATPTDTHKWLLGVTFSR